MEQTIILNTIPVKLRYYGDVSPEKIKKRVQKMPPQMILIIPGNPVMISNYYRFAECLHEKTKLPVWIVAYGGYSRDIEVPSPDKNAHLFNRGGLVQQQKDLYKKYLAGTEVFVVAHSYGCSLTLEVLEDVEISQTIRKAFLLFPLIERYSEVPEFKHTVLKFEPRVNIALNTFLQPLLQFLFQFEAVRWWVARTLTKLGNRDSREAFRIVEAVDITVLKVVDLIIRSSVDFLSGRPYLQALQKHKRKLKLCYGRNDSWVPLEFFYQLKREMPDLDAEINELGITHNFDIDSHKEMANLVTEWIDQELNG